MTLLTRGVAATLIVLVCAGCGGGSDGHSAGSSRSAAATDSASGSGSAGSSETPNLTFADLDAMVLIHGGDPDPLVSAFGSVWMKFADGKVERIDPANGRVLATVDTGYSAIPSCDMISADDDQIWTCAGPNKLLAIDPRDNTAARPVHRSFISDQHSLPWSAGKLWTIRGDARTVEGHAPDGTAATVHLGAFCTDLAQSESDTVLVAVCPTDAKVVVVDPRHAKVLGTISLPDPARAAVADDIWVSFRDGVAQIDPHPLKVMTVYKFAASTALAYGMWADGTEVWVRTAGKPFLTRIDPARQPDVLTVTSPRPLPEGSVIGHGRHQIWATAYNAQLIVRLSVD